MTTAEIERLDRTFRALGDETRRRIWLIVDTTPGTSTSQLTSAFPLLSRWAIMKHLAVLRDAGLIQTLPDGRKRRHYVVAGGLDDARRWLSRSSERSQP